MVSRVFRLLSSLVLVIGSACRSATPIQPVAPVAPAAVAQVPLTRILIAVDVNDSVDLCVQPTAVMLFEDPNLVGPVCGLTVGDLRAWLRRQARAD